MKNTVKYEGKNHRVFITETPYGSYPLIVVKRQYCNGNLALEALSCRKFDDGHYEAEDPFGVITSNLGDSLPENVAYIKTYSENEKWAKALAEKIGGVDLDMTASSGFCEFPMYDFSKIDIYVNDETD